MIIFRMLKKKMLWEEYFGVLLFPCYNGGYAVMLSVFSSVSLSYSFDISVAVNV